MFCFYMKARDLYAKLEEDFIKPGLSDEWFGMEDYGDMTIVLQL